MIVCLCPRHNPQQHYVGFRERENVTQQKCTPQVNTFVTTGTLTFQRWSARGSRQDGGECEEGLRLRRDGWPLASAVDFCTVAKPRLAVAWCMCGWAGGLHTKQTSCTSWFGLVVLLSCFLTQKVTRVRCCVVLCRRRCHVLHQLARELRMASHISTFLSVNASPCLWASHRCDLSAMLCPSVTSGNRQEM